MTKVHKVILLVVDHDNLGPDEVAGVLEHTRYPNDCMYPSVMAIETKEVEWSDEHPLNRTDTHHIAFQQLFGDAETGR